MLFEWDSRKAASNLEKHGISFEEAATVFGDSFSLTISDSEHSDAEDRFILLGQSYQAKTIGCGLHRKRRKYKNHQRLARWSPGAENL